MTDVTAIITGHREGLLAGPTISSFEQAIEHARSAGISVESVIVLDRPNDVTETVFRPLASRGHKLRVSDFGDPALSRMYGVEEATGRFVSFVDADDLWSYNWLTEAYAYQQKSTKRTICHSEMNITFGTERQMWYHVDSEAADFDVDYLRIGNYWDALCFAERDVFLEYPFKKNELGSGFGHEDWHWNCVTLAAGIAHRPVPSTVHFKRRRPGSQSARCDQSDVVIWPNDISRYAWPPVRATDETAPLF